MPHRESSLAAPAAPAFREPEGLRATLTRLANAGPGAWRNDPEAAALMEFAADRYASLARKYGLEPADAAVAAFEAMINDATRRADDPWAVVTVAVRITLIAESRAQGLLTSTERARRPEYSCFHDAQRFSDRDTDPSVYHPALQVAPEWDGGGAGDAAASMPAEQVPAIDDTVCVLTALGWPSGVAHAVVEYATGRLIDIGDRASAYDVLRRDKTARAMFDLPHPAWIGLLRIVLGHPGAPTRNGRRGLLARLLIGDTVEDLLADGDVAQAAKVACPAPVVTADG